MAAVAPATAAELRAPSAVDRDCTQAATGEPGVASRTLTAPGVSMVSTRMTNASGNWDLAVFQRSTGAVVAASTYGDGDETAQGFAAPGELVVQACRISGSDPIATLTTDLSELTQPAPRMQIVRVATPTAEAEDALINSGFDLTEHGGNGFVDVVLHSPAEGAMLADQGFSFQVIDADLAATTLAQRQADARILERGAASGLPSGRTGTYRRLFDYSSEMQAMADKHKRLVRYFTLPRETYEGRKVEAIEIAPRVKRRDGRPTFVLMGAHHAREWPSSEHTIEFAYELLKGWKQGNKRIRRLMRRSRVIFIPVVNPDGFNTSREAGEVLKAGGGRGGPDETANLVLPYEYHRKNCRFLPPNEDNGGSCLQLPNLGLSQFGVDPNRNYGGFWGGPGASDADTLPFGATAQDYRGPGPFSEPETQNIRNLLSRRQGITVISNHTFSNLLLRPPALQSAGKPPDAAVYKRFGDAMAGQERLHEPALLRAL